jgi:phosphoribosylformylglycinamidine (FGAM) synthase-like enzyme/phosphoribosylformylglycinamidine (FGAM) synthase-like amidotransferase family enzyme
MVLTRFYAKKHDDINYTCYYLESSKILSQEETNIIKSVLNLDLSPSEALDILNRHERGLFTEVGPKPEYTTPWGTHANMVLKRCNVNSVIRIEQSILYHSINHVNYDQMTHTIYKAPLGSNDMKTFTINNEPSKAFQVNSLDLATFNKTQNLGFDQFDMDLYQNIWSHNDHTPTSKIASSAPTSSLNKLSSSGLLILPSLPNRVDSTTTNISKYDEIDDMISNIDFNESNHSFFKLPPPPEESVGSTTVYDRIPHKTLIKNQLKNHHHKIPSEPHQSELINSDPSMEEPIYGNLTLTPPEKPAKFGKNKIPTDVELYDLSQSNSEHSRHWLFRGKLELNGQIMPHSLMDMIRQPLEKLKETRKLAGQKDNSLVAMADNSSAISGYHINYFQPVDRKNNSFLYREYQILRKLVHPIFTAETHNFPTGIAPFPGAATGTGGRIRDIQAMGRGGLMIAGTVGYCVGALHLKDDPETLAWESPDLKYPLHQPSHILIEASNGASDYGNKIGEPLIQGFCRSFGMNLQTYGDDYHRLEWVKPIMFTGGVGQVMDEHVHKLTPEEGWLIVRLGGPAYRIGVGGGAASSRSQGELDKSIEIPVQISESIEKGISHSSIEKGISKPQMIPKRKSTDFFFNRTRKETKETKEKGSFEDAFESCNNSNGNSKPGSLSSSLSWEDSTLKNAKISVEPPLKNINNSDFNAVQRDDPEMENRLNKVIRTCIELGPNNPILSIHDQGAGGMANVTKEIVSPLGGLVSLGNVHLGDQTLSAREKWIAEYQEQNTILIHPKSSQLLKDICKRENLPCQFVGFVSKTGRIQVYDPSAKSGNPVEMNPVDLNLQQVLESVPPKTFKMDISMKSQILPKPIPTISSIPIISSIPTISNSNLTSIHDMTAHYLHRVFRLLSVGSKRFLTNKVDRSVGGLIVQQQCVGPFHTPLADVAVVAQSYFSRTGIATSVAEQPIKGLLNPVRMARMTVGEMLTNLVWAPITRLSDIKCSGNWMWEKKYGDEIYALYQAVKSVTDIMQTIGVSIDGGKDSLSMSARVDNQDVLCPRSLVLSAYVTCPDINLVVTPDLKQPNNHLIYIDLGYGKNRTGGSSLAHVIGSSIGDEVPDLENPENFVGVFRLIQTFILDGLIESGHDRSDGGLLTTLVEMSIAGNYGFDLDLSNLISRFDPINHLSDITNLLFSEELGMVLEVTPKNSDNIITQLAKYAPVYKLGHVTKKPICQIIYKNPNLKDPNPKDVNNLNSIMILSQSVAELRAQWEETSFRLDLLQCRPECVKSEAKYLKTSVSGPTYRIPKTVIKMMSISTTERDNLITNYANSHQKRYKVAIIREQGSNGDREMAAAFQIAGFDVSDITTQDLLASQIDLNAYRGIAFVGGFSFADVLGAGRAWSLSLMSNPNVAKQLNDFKMRPDTFSLGICNGCQLMAELGWVPGKFVKNYSGRFESRWSTVKVLKSNSILLDGLEGLQLPIWVAHGEGRFELNNHHINNNQMVLAYVDDLGNETNDYPMNPNGSPNGLTGITSNDGRHLAMMPHPERSIMMWQTPYVTKEIKDVISEANYGTEEHGNYFPWLELFRNANRWCQK